MVSQKGLYSLLVGLIALMLVITIMAFSANNALADKSTSYKNDIIETKKTAQNLVLVLDKVLNDAITEYYSSGCGGALQSKVDAFFTHNEIRNRFKDCTVTVNSVTPVACGPASTTAAFTVSCTKTVPGNLTANYIASKTFTRTITSTSPLIIMDGTAQEYP